MSAIVIGLLFLGSYPGTASHGQMSIYDNDIATTIQVIDQWHPAYGVPSGEYLENMTFETGSVATVSSFSDYGGTVAGTILATTSGDHGFTTGDPITILGTNVEATDAAPYYGTYSITVVNSTTFYFTATWTETSTAFAYLPDRFVIQVPGFYHIVAAGAFTSAGSNKDYEFVMWKNTTPITAVAQHITSKNASLYSAVPGVGAFTAVADDVIWYAVMGTTDASDFTLHHATIQLMRVR